MSETGRRQPPRRYARRMKTRRNLRLEGRLRRTVDPFQIQVADAFDVPLRALFPRTPKGAR